MMGDGSGWGEWFMEEAKQPCIWGSWSSHRTGGQADFHFGPCATGLGQFKSQFAYLFYKAGQNVQ